jgi:hypothetical protein
MGTGFEFFGTRGEKIPDIEIIRTMDREYFTLFYIFYPFDMSVRTSCQEYAHKPLSARQPAQVW